MNKRITSTIPVSGLKSIFWGVVLACCCGDPEPTPTYGCKDSHATNYDASATNNNSCLCRYDGVYSCGITEPSNLAISPIQQETEVWCWLAVGEMLFKHYGLPNMNSGNNYQCGIINVVGYSLHGACDACWMNCGNCVVPAGSPSTISYMLTTYPKVACKELFTANKTLKNSYVSNYLSAAFLTSELDANRPVIAGINPGTQFVLSGNSQHVAIIKGYFYDGYGNLILWVNDPYPYWTRGFDPYLYNGALTSGDLSYQIPYLNFVSGLKWNTSWYGIGW